MAVEHTLKCVSAELRAVVVVRQSSTGILPVGCSVGCVIPHQSQTVLVVLHFVDHFCAS